jgi:hypothetical protein
MTEQRVKLNHKVNTDTKDSDYIYDSINNTITKGQHFKKIINHFKENKAIPTNLLIISKTGILNQGTIGTCGPNALSVVVSIASNSKINNACRLYSYFNTQCIDKSNPFRDTGVTTTSLINFLIYYKTCPEKLMTYNPANYFVLPPITTYKNTYNIRNVVYRYINQNGNMLKNIQNCLINTSKYPNTQSAGIFVGFKVFSNFPRTAGTGIVPMPRQQDTIVGGHAVAIVGYKKINGKTYIIFQNSWGNKWGDKGYGYFPVEYLNNRNYCERAVIISLNI